MELEKVETLSKRWRNRGDYKGYDRSKGSPFNSWRSIIYTQKGVTIGYPESWRSYDAFIKDVQGTWERGKIACRFDKSKPHGPSNTYWAEKGTESMTKLSKLTYEGETKTLVEWCDHYGLNFCGVRQRYYRGKNYTPQEILFGKARKLRSKWVLDSEQKLKQKLRGYRERDRKKGFTCNISLDTFRELIAPGCFYCGEGGDIGLDRVQNDAGHVTGNVVPCCYTCNCARNDNFTHAEMVVLGKTIKAIKEARETNI